LGKTVYLNDLRSGMVLAADLHGANGRFLLPSGTPLEDTHLRIFKIWGVSEAVIDDGQAPAEADPPAPEPAQDPGTTGPTRGIVDKRFALSTQDSPALEEIKRYCALRLGERIAAGHKPPELAPFRVDVTAVDDAGPKKPMSIEELVAGQVKLVTLSDVFHQIQHVIDDPRATSSHIAEIVSRDSSLSARLLKLVNSPFYGLPSRVETISRAVSMIGGCELMTLAQGLAVVEAFKDIPSALFDMRCFWEHSVGAGICARLLGHHKVGLSEERLFVGGLIHDVGVLVMVRAMPRLTARAFQLARSEKISQSKAEREVFGFSHGDVAGALFKEWKIPASLLRMARFHATPGQAFNPTEASIVHVADVLSFSLALVKGLAVAIPPLSPKAWEEVDLPAGVLVPTMQQAERQITETVRLFHREAA
jgi:HD-like signal output (HDOD) protein